MKKPIFPLKSPLQFAQYQQTIRPRLLRTEMEGGLPKQARRYGATLVEHHVLYYVTKEEYHHFMAWFYTDADLGARWFDWLNPVTQHIQSARLVNGEMDALPLSADQAYWQLRFVLETRE